ncbi:MAG: 50S ribosomal protein L4 [Candidatus Paceibacterota bacterium]|jgi:large subunit ribosomal protein L4
MKIEVYNLLGESTKEIIIPESFSKEEIVYDLLHETLISLQKNQRQPWAHTKDRSEVRGGGKKPWKQKGTGRARHGSSRSPLWRGGGVTFGPLNTDIPKRKINKKSGRKTFIAVFIDALKNKKIVVVENLAIEEPKTKFLINKIEKFLSKEEISKKCLIIVDKLDKNLKLASQNLSHLTVLPVNNINIESILMPKKILITESAFGKILKK